MWLRGPWDQEKESVNKQRIANSLSFIRPSLSSSLFLLPHPSSLPCPPVCLWWLLRNITKETPHQWAASVGMKRRVVERGALTQYLMKENWRREGREIKNGEGSRGEERAEVRSRRDTRDEKNGGRTAGDVEGECGAIWREGVRGKTERERGREARGGEEERDREGQTMNSG